MDLKKALSHLNWDVWLPYNRWEDNIKMDLKRNRMWWYELD
jgi:hypothetical protein